MSQQVARDNIGVIIAEAQAQALEEAADALDAKASEYERTHDGMAEAGYLVEDIIRYGAYGSRIHSDAHLLRVRAANIRRGTR